ncbi:MAG: prevent-host-death family protein [Gammaproteobacteria bacterium]|nr:MAG: prevent-host-death family protein [Gammaproteobacteria bacterium]
MTIFLITAVKQSFLNGSALSSQPILIMGSKNNAVMISQQDYSAIEETIYLNSIPRLSKSIQEMMQAPDDEFSQNISW